METAPRDARMNKFNKYIVLAAKTNGHWNEYKFSVSDGRWQEALKVLKDSSDDLRIIYR
jgi:hypothetical protein